MVEAKIVAARTQRCWRTVHVAPRAARITSASHGLARAAIMPSSRKPSPPLLSDLLSAASAGERASNGEKVRPSSLLPCRRQSFERACDHETDQDHRSFEPS